MTIEEAREIIKQFRDRQGNSSDDIEAFDLVIEALDQQPNRCDSCTHSEEQDGSNCYECVKGMADNFEAQQTEMRDATEEERKSVRDYIRSISKPTGVQFEAQPTDVDCVSREAVLDAIRKNTFRLTFAEEQNCEGRVAWSAEVVYSDVIEGAILGSPPVTPQPKTGHWITTRTFMHDGEYYCDKCKCDAPNNEKWDYCPNCGAKMEVKK